MRYIRLRGDTVISIVADLQDPPEMVTEMIRKWEEGYSVVIGIKETAEEHPVMFWIRRKYYRLVNRLSGIDTIENFTGFGLYDRKVVENLIKQFDDPYPYFRGMIAEVGLPRLEIPYRQPQRKRGITKNNFYSLYDLAMLGITNLSKVPLGLVTFSGFACALLLRCWSRSRTAFTNYCIGAGSRPELRRWSSACFFFMSLQMIFIGVIGEYIGTDAYAGAKAAAGGGTGPDRLLSIGRENRCDQGQTQCRRTQSRTALLRQMRNSCDPRS